MNPPNLTKMNQKGWTAVKLLKRIRKRGIFALIVAAGSAIQSVGLGAVTLNLSIDPTTFFMARRTPHPPVGPN